MASTASPTAWLPPRGTHNITIGSSIRRSLSKHQSHDGEQPPQPLRNDFVAMRYNLKPPAVANAAGSLVSSDSYSHKDAYELELNAETGERHSFTARSETKKEVDCVLFYDPDSGTLVLERLDSLLSLTHQRNPSSSNSLQTSHNNGLPLNRPSPTPAPTAATALALHLPPTPPSTSPPGYTALPESIRTKENSIPRAKPKLAKGAPKKANHNANVGADIQPPPRGVSPKPIGTLDAYASSDATPATSPVPSLIRDAERRTNESRPYLAKRSTASDFASEPDEEVMTFGTAGTAEDNNGQDEMDATMPASNNALRLSDIPSRRAKRKFSDEEPDEEVLEFGRPAQEIKRAKTASQSPASIAAHTPAAMSDYTAPSPHSRPAPYQSVPLRSSAAAYGSKMVHGSSPLAAAMVLSSSSDDDDSDDDEFEEVMTSNVVPAPGGDPDGEEDDFLAAAFNDDDDTLGLQDGAASDHSDDSSDESDYDER